ncbi:OmpA family protein [Flavobacterium sp.]|uniref:OmpA family protein n=1 Tax=Flavobacterium sp. TaxID=239 RepID=UPI00286EA8A5|nr:OmpA family protein [Flavobacterium sp.]
MKNILKTLPLYLLVSFSVTITAQNIEKGDKQYKDLAYVDAIKTYERIANKGYKSVDLFQKLGNSYYFNAKLKEANVWYKELFAMNEKVEPEYYYRYSQTLKSVEDYTNADKYLEKFYSMSSADSRASMFKNQKNYKEVIAKNSGRYEIKNTEINSRLSDYGAAFYNDQVIFATSRDTVATARVSTKWTKNSFLNLYSAERAEDGSLSNAKKFSKSVNSKFHEDSPVFTKNQKIVYFTRNNYTKGKVGKDAEDVILLKLYRASLVEDKWIDVVEVPFNSDNYSIAHPALSPDEKTLYFASNMPGTKGMSDLFKVDITGDNTYSTPVNLTGALNTEGRETFPYITEDNELYFASDGHQGLGGLDVFVTKLGKDGMPAGIINVGAPINGPMDDFAFIIDKKNNSGYFSSNRDGGKGLDDIYSFTETKKIELECNQELIGVITNSETGQILDNAKVTLLDDKFIELQVTQSDEKGNYSFKVDCDKKYYVRGEKDEYDTKEAIVSIPNKSGKTELQLATAKKIREIKVGTDLAKVLDIPIIYFDLDKSFIRRDAALELEKVLDVMELNPGITIDVRSHTDSRQTFQYNESLSDRRAKSTIAWLIKKGIKANRLKGQGYGETQLVNQCADGVECSEEEHQRNRRSEFIVVKM